MSDWPARFKQLDKQEMDYDIQMLTCYLPDPWYRIVAQTYVILSFCGGITGMVVAGCLEIVWLAITFGCMACSMFPVILKYDDWTNDPCSIILDKKMYREEEEGRGAFKSYSRINDHRIGDIHEFRHIS